MGQPEDGVLARDQLGTRIAVVAAIRPTLQRRGDELHRSVVVRRIGQTGAVGPDRILQHPDALALVRDHVEVVWRVELAGGRVDRLEHLGVLVVGHRLGRVDVTFEQTDHVELLGDVLHRGRIDAVLRHRRKHLELVAEAPVADLLAGEVGRRRDALVLEAHLQRARALEHLGDVDDVRTRLATGERLGHPGNREVRVAVGQDRLRNDVDGAFENRDVEALVLVEALIDRCEVPGELGLRDPLQLQLHRRRSAAFGAGPCGLGRSRSRSRRWGFGRSGSRSCRRCCSAGARRGRRRTGAVAAASDSDERQSNGGGDCTLDSLFPHCYFSSPCGSVSDRSLAAREVTCRLDFSVPRRPA